MPASELIPAEALIVLNPARWHGREGIKLTYLTLLARGVLRLTMLPATGWFRGRKTVLQLGASAAPVRSGAESALLGIVRAQGSGGAPMADVIRQAQSIYGTDLNRFDRDLVRPGLIHRGLLTEARRSFLMLFTVRRDELTPAGEAARRLIEQAMAQARTIPDFLARDPAQAAALAVSAGAAIFLVPELRAHYTRLSAVLRIQGGADGGDGDGWDSSSQTGGIGDPAWHGLDAGLDFSWFGDFDFDGFDAAMDSFDSSFDGAAGGGDG
ncbi:MAG: hypothetical protein JO162_12200, partial [Alphaproteobacteria bacterium]|nr:hypothetical protein [Alphaproteobacteria bacterium]